MNIFKYRSKVGLKRVIDKFWKEMDFYVPNYDDDEDCDGISTYDIERTINEIIPLEASGADSDDSYYCDIELRLNVETTPGGSVICLYHRIDTLEGSNQGSYEEMIDLIWRWLEIAQERYIKLRKAFKPNCLRE